jgi:hypothetical protein
MAYMADGKRFASTGVRKRLWRQSVSIWDETAGGSDDDMRADSGAGM